MTHQKVINSVSLAVVFLAASADALAESYHKTSTAVDYKCIFNHELLIICGKKDNSSRHIQSFIEKLKDTDVDAVMCCPTAWRTNLFPSEVDSSWKKYRPDQPLSKFPSYDYVMRYLHSGGDPVKDTLEACRKCGKDFFISYRMNDGHYLDDLEWPTHNAIWREHPEYRLGDASKAVYGYSKADDLRVFNYMIPEVREYYFSILKELCTNYDVDGVELDFQRHCKFFRTADVEQGTAVMTSLVKRIREMLDQIGRERQKSLKLCVRVPQTLEICRQAGLDMPGWDKLRLVDMINVSSCYFHTIELGIEEFKAAAKHARIYGEMNYVTAQTPKNMHARHYTTIPVYHASALNLFARGADGLSLFNYDYVPEKQRLPMAEGLKRITDVEYLKTMPKDYVLYRGFGTFPATNKATVRLIIPDDTKKVTFRQALLRLQTKENCSDARIEVRLNGRSLEACRHDDPELYPPLAQNECYPSLDVLKFYTVPLDALIAGANQVEITNLDSKKRPCVFYSLEIALDR